MKTVTFIKSATTWKRVLFAAMVLGGGWAFAATLTKSNINSQSGGFNGSYVSVSGLAADTDGDGAEDNVDIDSDNDGIPDVNECRHTDYYWTKPPIFSGNTVTGTVNGVGYTLTSTVNNGATSWLYGHSTFPAIFHVPNQRSIKIKYAQTSTITFDTPVTNPVMLFASIGSTRRTVPVSFTDPIEFLFALNVTPISSTEINGTEAATIVKFNGTFTSIGFEYKRSENYANFVIGMEVDTSCDTDNDGIPNYLDLDSDNDGIPDNVEAQNTNGYTQPSGTDSDNDGLDDAYDTDNGGTSMVLPDTDGDGTPDYLDTDSDGDGITDCEEGLPDTTYNKSCPVDNNNVGTNGLIDWAENIDGYSDVNGIVDTPDTNLENETGDTAEMGYREILCGRAERTLTPMHWVVFSAPCNTGSATISDLFGNSLGAYGENNHWVMYRQNTSYTGSNTDDMELMTANDTLEVGKGYWLIVDNSHAGADGNVTMKLDTSILANFPSGSTGKTPTLPKGNYGIGAGDDVFDEVHEIDWLPDAQNGKKTKIMLGNPFVRTYHAGRIYYENSSMSAYDAIIESTIGNYVEQVFYMHDSPDLKPGTGGNNGEYIAVTPSGTPGFGDTIAPMYGYWMLLKPDTGATGNKITMPFEKK